MRKISLLSGTGRMGRKQTICGGWSVSSGETNILEKPSVVFHESVLVYMHVAVVNATTKGKLGRKGFILYCISRLRFIFFGHQAGTQGRNHRRWSYWGMLLPPPSPLPPLPPLLCLCLFLSPPAPMENSHTINSQKVFRLRGLRHLLC